VGCGEQQKDWLLLAAKLDFQDGRSVKANGTLSLAFLMLLKPAICYLAGLDCLPNTCLNLIDRCVTPRLLLRKTRGSARQEGAQNADSCSSPDGRTSRPAYHIQLPNAW
jgi:hypothetical protein